MQVLWDVQWFLLAYDSKVFWWQYESDKKQLQQFLWLLNIDIKWKK